jgi:hypothetical protein
MTWFSQPKDRIVRRWEGNNHWVFYAGNGEWTRAVEKAHKFTLKEAQAFLSSTSGAQVSIALAVG